MQVGSRLDQVGSEAGGDGAGQLGGCRGRAGVCRCAGQRWAEHGAAGGAPAGDAGPAQPPHPSDPGASGEGSLGHGQVRREDPHPTGPAQPEEKLKGERLSAQLEKWLVHMKQKPLVLPEVKLCPVCKDVPGRDAHVRAGGMKAHLEQGSP